MKSVKDHKDYENLKNIPTAALHEAYGEKGALPYNIKPIDSKMKLCGPALTRETRGSSAFNLHTFGGEIISFEFGTGPHNFFGCVGCVLNSNPIADHHDH